MTVYGMKQNQMLIINDDLTITVIEIRSDKVRLGIEAPRQYRLYRKEVYDAIQAMTAREPAPPPAPVVPPPAPVPPPVQVTLSERQLALIDRLRASIRESTGTQPTPEEALAVLFDAFEGAERNLGRFLFDAVRGRQATT